MAKINKKPKEDHSNDWLSTYGDMVTLLLTFFVLLYASSSQDDQKFQYIYQAFTSHGKYLNQYVDSPNPVPEDGEGTVSEKPDSNGGQGNLPQSFDQLYQYMSQYVSENNLEQSISLDSGAVFPAFGMLGTVVGLVNMLNTMGTNPDGLAAGMATALITTFYGSLFANVLFNPMASALQNAHNDELLCMQIIEEGVLAIAEGSNPRYIQEKLEFMLPSTKKRSGKAAG